MSGKRGKGISVDLRKHSIECTRGRLLKTLEDHPKNMYEEVDDSGRRERGMERCVWHFVLSDYPARDTV